MYEAPTPVEYLSAFKMWLAICSGLLVITSLLVYLYLIVRGGPAVASQQMRLGVAGVFADWMSISCRRVLALTKLAIQESIRRKVLVAFVAFIIMMLFAGWYLDPEGDRPAKTYLTFVMTLSSYVSILMGLVLSVFSLPNDIEDKTIFTIVSKPVRQNEIVLGRILGFTATGTAVIVVMSLISLVFVYRGLDHDHTVNLASQTKHQGHSHAGHDHDHDHDHPEDSIVSEGNTMKSHGHLHSIQIKEDGTGITDATAGHWHEVTVDEVHGKKRYEFSAPYDLLQARVPVYGKLQFYDRNGEKSEKGINVGKEWSYHGYIEGGSKAKAEWTFEGISEDMFPDGLPLELALRVFRLHKGIIEQGILGSIVLINPDNGIESEPQTFLAKEYYTDEIFFPRKILDRKQKEADIFKDFVYGGKLIIRITCESNAQYFGMAANDVYLRANDVPFVYNYFKGYIGIWLQMVLVIIFGVMFSTFLRGSVALLATIGAITASFNLQMLVDIGTGQNDGGGPVESFIRLLQKKNPVIPLEEGLSTEVTGVFDWVFKLILYIVSHVVPDLLSFNNSYTVAQGFDINWEIMTNNFLTAIAYSLPVILIAHICLKAREVA